METEKKVLVEMTSIFSSKEGKKSDGKVRKFDIVQATTILKLKRPMWKLTGKEFKFNGKDIVRNK